MKVKVRKGDSTIAQYGYRFNGLYTVLCWNCIMLDTWSQHLSCAHIVLGQTSPEVFTISGASMILFFYFFCCSATCMCVFVLACVLGQHRFTHMACCVRQYPSSAPWQGRGFLLCFSCGLKKRTCSDHKAFPGLSLSVHLGCTKMAMTPDYRQDYNLKHAT